MAENINNTQREQTNSVESNRTNTSDREEMTKLVRNLRFASLLLFIMAGVTSLLILWLWPFVNTTNHTNNNPDNSILFFVVSLVMTISLYFVYKTYSKLTVINIVICVLGLVTVFSYNKFNIMLNYEVWIARGLPAAFETIHADCNFDYIKDAVKKSESYEDAFSIVEGTCGEPDQDLGSGVYIPSWNLPGGASISLSAKGVVYTDFFGKQQNLVETRNILKDNISGVYDVSVYDLETDTYYYVGYLSIDDDGVYEFVPSSTSDSHYDAVKDTELILKYPKGTYTLAYTNDHVEGELLEDIEKYEPLVEINMVPEGWDQAFKMFIYADSASRRITLGSSTGEIEVVNIDKQWKDSYYTEDQGVNE